MKEGMGKAEDSEEQANPAQVLNLLSGVSQVSS